MSHKKLWIDMMKSVDEIAYEIWTVLWFLPICGKIWPWPKVKVIRTWVIKCTLLGCTLVPIMKCILVGEIASEIWPVLWFFTHFWTNLTLTLTQGLGHRHLGHWMCLIWLYLVTKYEVCRWNSIRDMAHLCRFWTFDLDLWPWPLVRVIGTWVIKCALLGCILVPSMKSLGRIGFEIWTQV